MPDKSLYAGAVLLLLALVSPASVNAQDATTSDPVAEAFRARGEAYRRAPDEKQTAQELSTTRALNAEIAAQNDLAEMQDRANQNAHAKAQSEYQAELARVEAERRRIESETAAQQATYGANQTLYQRQLADWQACSAGDRTRCRPQ